MRIATKVGVLVASVLAISLLVQVFYIFPQIKAREYRLQVTQNEISSSSIVADVRSVQEDIRREVEILARMPEIRSGDVEKQEAVLSFSVRSSSTFATISIANINGVITSVESRDPAIISLRPKTIGMDISDEDYFKSCVLTGETYYSELFRGSFSDLIRAVIATPIRANNGDVVAVIFADVPINTLAGIVESVYLDETESAYMVDKDGFVVAHSVKNLTELSECPLQVDYSGYAVVDALMNGNSGITEYDYKGETYLACYTVVGPSGWGIVFQEPLQVILAKSNVLTNFLFGINTAVFVAAVLATLLLARRIINPLHKLANYAGRVESGDYTAELEVEGKDEIADVTSAIKSMVQQILTMQEDEIVAIVSSMQDGLIVLDKNQHITRLNPAMEQMLGVRAAEVINKSISELETTPRLMPLARLSQVQSPDDEMIITEPYDRVLRVHSSRLNDMAGRDLGEVRVVLDVTRERELDQMKSDFIANVSHELRTPLHSIRGFVKLMLDGTVSDEKTQKEFLSIIDEQSLHLSNLVSSILDMAVMESGEIVLERQPVSIKEVIDKVVVRLRKIADDKKITVEADVPETLPIIEGDSEKLEQVITNLVHNAIKFNSEGGRVTVAAVVRNSRMLVQIVDQGIGIPAGDVPHLFDKFFKVDGSMPWTSSGTGLGLYIVKQIIEAHGGKIWVESSYGEGSAFSFELPLIGDRMDQQKGG